MPAASEQALVPMRSIHASPSYTLTVRPLRLLPFAPIAEASTSRRAHWPLAGRVETRMCAVDASIRSSPHEARYSLAPSLQAKRISRGGLQGLMRAYATR